MSDQTPTITLDQLLKHWQGHRGLTRRVIEAFPDEHLFSFSLGGMRPFGEMAAELVRMAAPLVEGAATGEWQGYESEVPTTKAGLLARWDDDTQRIDERWRTIPEGRFAEEDAAFGVYRDRVQGLLQYAIDNEIHHRAQGYVYLRALGVEPPPFWER